MGPQLDLLEDRHLVHQPDLPQAQPAHVGVGAVGLRVQGLELHLALGVGPVVHAHRLHVRLAALPVQPVHVVLLGAMDVDGLVMEHLLGAEQVHLADDAAAGHRTVHHHHVVRRGGAQAHLLRGIGVGHPVVASVGGVQDALLGQVVQDLGDALAPERLVGGERQLEGRALQVAGQDDQVVRVDGGVLGRATEEVVRIAHDVLVGR